jgi:hypothetical protein
VSDPATRAKPEGRAAHAISQVYYYVAAVGGFGMFLGGVIAVLFGIRELILPRGFETTRDGIRGLWYGLSFVLPGLAVIRWHLRQARSREATLPTTVFWGRVLYFHLIALVSLLFVMIGTVGVLVNLGDAATSTCESLPRGVVSIPHEVAEGSTVPTEAPLVEGSCYPTRDDALRNAMDASIFLIVAGPVFWWHLRQGRRLTAPPPDEPQKG